MFQLISSRVAPSLPDHKTYSKWKHLGKGKVFFCVYLYTPQIWEPSCITSFCDPGGCPRSISGQLYAKLHCFSFLVSAALRSSSAAFFYAQPAPGPSLPLPSSWPRQPCPLTLLLSSWLQPQHEPSRLLLSSWPLQPCAPPQLPGLASTGRQPQPKPLPKQQVKAQSSHTMVPSLRRMM